MTTHVKLKKDEFLLYSFKNLDIEDLIDYHIEINTITTEERKREYIDEIHRLMQDDEVVRKLNLELKVLSKGKKKLPTKQRLPLHNKFTYLIHLIAKNSNFREPSPVPQIRILASFIKKIFNDNEYHKYIYTLFSYRVFIGSFEYKKNKYSRLYNVNDKYYNYDNIVYTPSSHKVIKEYINRSNIELDKYVKTDFDKTYNKNLSKIKLIKKEEAEDYVNEITSKKINERKKLIYLKSLQKLIDYNSKNYIRLIRDKNGRIYHVLTNIKREFKEFINISYQVDIKNSHPLIFNNFLIKDCNINNDKLNLLFQIINFISYNNNIYSFNINNSFGILLYNDSDKSLSELIYRILQNTPTLTDTIPLDVLTYIILTSKGQMWDLLIEQCSAVGLGMFRGKPVDRNSIKEKMFKEVFYSNREGLSYKLDNCNKAVEKRYGKVFYNLFPNVYNVIEYNKFHKPKETEDEKPQLSNEMMSLEAKLFRAILKELFKHPNLDVISIHDAILVLNTSDEKYKPELIENVITKIYHKYNLFPSVSIDYYNPINQSIQNK